MRVAVIANSKAEGVALARDSVCRALRDLGAELLLPPDCAATWVLWRDWSWMS